MKTISLCYAALLSVVSVAVAGEATLYRDTYGVPHVYADTQGAGAYALGYAQAEDRLADLYDNVRIATGRMAEVHGKEHVEQDYFMRVARNEDRAREYWEQDAPDYLREICERFVQGVQAYLADHPAAQPDNALDLQPWHLLSIGRAMILRWPLGNIMGDLKSEHKNPGIGSNGWAIAPSRMTDGSAVLLADPHLEWAGMSVFYQAVVHAGDLHMDGFFLVGSPLVGIGHNGYVAWACTTGGPDTGDVFQMKLNPRNPMQYEYDGEWKTAEIQMISIPVKDSAPVVRPAVYTMHGPAVAEPDLKNGAIMVGSTPYFTLMDTFEQTYRMCMAKNAAEFYAALEINALMDQNIPYADRDGNIGYVRVGRTPIRPEGYNWRAPVPGWTSATAYRGIHPLTDHVQILNPPQGYLQNTNISPANMMVDSPMTPDKYPDYLYNVTWDTDNPRSRRIIQLLHQHDQVTRDQAKDFATDVYDLLAKPWQAALREAVEAAGQQHMADAGFAAAVDAILAWEGHFVKEATATPLLKHWRLKCQNQQVDVAAIAAGARLEQPAQEQLLALLAESIAEMREQYGDALFPWGDIYVIGRGGVYYPSDGADFGASVEGPNFTETLWDVRYKPLEGEPGKFVGNNGTMALLLTFLHKDKVEAYSAVPWGVSADPASPHYMDQGRDFYSPRTLKPTWFHKEDLLQHVASEKTLSIP